MSPNEIALIEFMTMVEPIAGSMDAHQIVQSAGMAVSDDFKKVQMALSKVGYDAQIDHSVHNIKVYGKVKVAMTMRVLAPADSDIAFLKNKFWTQDEKLTGAVMKPRAWGKK
jgi:hypothetical protein